MDHRHKPAASRLHLPAEEAVLLVAVVSRHASRLLVLYLCSSPTSPTFPEEEEGGVKTLTDTTKLIETIKVTPFIRTF